MADQEHPKRGRGRPKQYASAADRARAWRQRQADLIAQARQPAAPMIVEKIIEKVVEIPVDRNMCPPSQTGRSKAKGSVPDAARLVSVLRPKFGAYGGEDHAKRLRVNAARAASLAREILGLCSTGEAIPETEKDFLLQAAQFFEGLNEGRPGFIRNPRKSLLTDGFDLEIFGVNYFNWWRQPGLWLNSGGSNNVPHTTLNN